MIKAKNVEQGMLIRGLLGMQFVRVTAVSRQPGHMGDEFCFSYAGEVSEPFRGDHQFVQGDPEHDEPFEDVGYRG